MKKNFFTDSRNLIFFAIDKPPNNPSSFVMQRQHISSTIGTELSKKYIGLPVDVNACIKKINTIPKTDRFIQKLRTIEDKIKKTPNKRLLQEATDLMDKYNQFYKNYLNAHPDFIPVDNLRFILRDYAAKLGPLAKNDKKAQEMINRLWEIHRFLSLRRSSKNYQKKAQKRIKEAEDLFGETLRKMGKPNQEKTQEVQNSEQKTPEKTAQVTPQAPSADSLTPKPKPETEPATSAEKTVVENTQKVKPPSSTQTQTSTEPAISNETPVIEPTPPSPPQEQIETAPAISKAKTDVKPLNSKTQTVTTPAPSKEPPVVDKTQDIKLPPAQKTLRFSEKIKISNSAVLTNQMLGILKQKVPYPNSDPQMASYRLAIKKWELKERDNALNPADIKPVAPTFKLESKMDEFISFLKSPEAQKASSLLSSYKKINAEWYASVYSDKAPSANDRKKIRQKFKRLYKQNPLILIDPPHFKNNNKLTEFMEKLEKKINSSEIVKKHNRKVDEIQDYISIAYKRYSESQQGVQTMTITNNGKKRSFPLAKAPSSIILENKINLRNFIVAYYELGYSDGEKTGISSYFELNSESIH